MRQTWEEIKNQYPNEHVVITNLSTSPKTPAVVEAGEVVDHDVELDDLLKRCDLSQYDCCAIKYTGDFGELIGERGMVRVVHYD